MIYLNGQRDSGQARFQFQLFHVYMKINEIQFFEKIEYTCNYYFLYRTFD